MTKHNCLSDEDLIELAKQEKELPTEICECSTCQSNIAFWQKVLELGTSLQFPQAELIKKATKLPIQARASEKQDLELKLIFDSSRQCTAIGVRTGFPASRRLKYKSSQFQLNLRWAPSTKESGILAVQIEPPLPCQLYVQSRKCRTSLLFDHSGFAIGIVHGIFEQLKFMLKLPSGGIIKLSDMKDAI